MERPVYFSMKKNNNKNIFFYLPPFFLFLIFCRFDFPGRWVPPDLLPPGRLPPVAPFFPPPFLKGRYSETSLALSFVLCFWPLFLPPKPNFLSFACLLAETLSSPFLLFLFSKKSRLSVCPFLNFLTSSIISLFSFCLFCCTSTWTFFPNFFNSLNFFTFSPRSIPICFVTNFCLIFCMWSSVLTIWAK